jgi:prepilin-type N-terminal cleavage/methylation domain-containing protein
MLKRRLCFTLLEMLVVISLFVVIAGAVGMNVAGAIREARFRSGVELVIDKLQMAQDLMLIMNQDVRVQFDKVDDKLRCLFEVDTKLTPALKTVMNSSTDISGIRSWEFVDPDSHRKEEGKFSLEFFGSGTKMSRGELRLYGADKERYKETVILPGYPFPIGKGTDPSRLDNNNHETSYEALYPKEIRKLAEEAQRSSTGSSQTVLPSS